MIRSSGVENALPPLLTDAPAPITWGPNEIPPDVRLDCALEEGPELTAYFFSRK